MISTQRDQHLPLGMALCIVVLSSHSYAAESRSGVRPTAISVPTGPGTIRGLGESFQTTTNLGQGTYSIPLMIPRGTAGYAPSISLTYTSGGGVGELGIGWRLTGPTKVQRQARLKVPTFDDGLDQFEADDTRLVQIGEYYRCEHESSFIRYRRMPDGWRGQDKTGQQLWFGTSSQSREGPSPQVFAWRLERSEDASGNGIKYTYLRDGGRLYISRIDYNDRPGAADNHIDFIYDSSRPDVRESFRNGYLTKTRLRLREIVMWVGDHRAWSYRLEYEVESGISRLGSVKMIGSDNHTEMPTTSFGYSSASTDSFVLQPVEIPSAVNAFSDDVTILDVDGDSLPDIFQGRRGEYQWWRNLGARFSSARGFSSSPSVSLGDSNTTLIDVDGDGRADLLNASSRFRYSRNDRTTWGTLREIPGSTGVSLGEPNVRLMDYDGDGDSDIVRSATGPNWLWWENEGPSMGLRRIGTQPAPEGDVQLGTETTRIVDFNNDGLNDLIKIRAESIQVWTYQAYGRWSPSQSVPVPAAENLLAQNGDRLELRDLDGDGLADLVQIRFSQLRVWFQRRGGDGPRFEPPIVVTGTPQNDPARTRVQLMDLNGDGGTDVVYLTPTAPPERRALRVDFNQGVRPHLLLRIENGLGARTEIKYRGSGPLAAEASPAWTSAFPTPVQVVTEIHLSDGTGWSGKSTFEYRNGYFSHSEREFRGFEEVVERKFGDASSDTLRTVTRYDLGRIFRSRRSMPVSQTDWSESENQRLRERRFQLATTLDATRQIEFSYTATITVDHYEGLQDAVSVLTAYRYDSFGNQTAALRYGRINQGDDDRGDESFSFIDYIVDESAWLFRPGHERIVDGDGLVLLDKRHFYDGPPLLGLPYGELKRGYLTRTEEQLKLAPEEMEQRIDTYRVERDAFGNVTRAVDAVGRQRKFKYDDNTHRFLIREDVCLEGGPEQCRDPLIFEARYNELWATLRELIDPNRQTTSFFTDPLGRLAKIVRPGDTESQPTESFDYELGSPLSYVETRRRRSRESLDVDVHRQYYDGLGRSRLELTAILPKDRYGADSPQPNGIPSSWTCGIPPEWSEDQVWWLKMNFRRYDARGNLSTAYSPSYVTTITPQQPASSSLEKIEYDALNRETRRVFANGSQRLRKYLPLVVVETDRNNHRFHKRFDGLDRWLSTTVTLDDEPRSVQVNYDALDQLARVIDAENNVRSVEYNSQGWLLRVEDPDAGTAKYRYNAAGELVLQQNGAGELASFGYDGAGRRKWEDYSPGGDHDVSYTYDRDEAGSRFARGRLIKVEDQVGIHRLGYDARGRVVREERIIDGKAHAVEHAYDPQDRLTATRYSDSVSIVRKYDGRGRLVAVEGVLERAFDAYGKATWQRTADGTETIRCLDEMHRVRLRQTSASQQVVRDQRYDYDPLGNVVASRDEQRRTVEASTYAYDALSRLRRLTSSTGTLTWSLSASGRILSQSGEGAFAGLAVRFEHGDGAGPHAITSVIGPATRQLSYDAAGRLRADGSRALTWDSMGRLREVRTTGATTKLDYAYDGSLLRRRRLEGEDITEAVDHIFDSLELRNEVLYAVVNDNGIRLAQIPIPPSEAPTLPPASCQCASSTSESIVGIAKQVAVLLLLVAGWTLRRRASSGAMAAVCFAALVANCSSTADDSNAPLKAKPPAVFFHQDRQQSVSELSREGTPIESFAYLPYGQARGAKPGGDAPFGFSGNEYDGSTGLYYYAARPYDPQLMAWTTPDHTALRNPQVLLETEPFSNPYAFSRGNPVRFVDPDGDVPIETAADIIDIGVSTVELINEPSWMNAGLLAWSVAATLIPYVPGAWVKRASSAGGALIEQGIKNSRRIDDIPTPGAPCKGCVDLCFAEGTPVATGQLDTVPIESLRVGTRVRTAGGSSSTNVSADWRQVALVMTNTKDVRDQLFIELLRPPSWFDDQGVFVGSRVFLNLPELGTSGWATAVSIEAARIRKSEGRVVTGTVNHLNSDVYEVGLGDRVAPLRVTGSHPLYSLDRSDWVRVRDLQVGERLQTAEGAVTVEALEKVRGVHRVYNLEVEGDHEYLVGEAGVRAHNSCVVDDVIAETNAGRGRLTSAHTLTPDEALEAGERWVGPGYREIGGNGSGVFRADNARQFRMDNASLSGAHAPHVPHVHLEKIGPDGRRITTNNHIPLKDD